MCNRIQKCFIGGKYSDEIKELNALGIETISLPANDLLDEEINSHADILVFNCLNGTIIADSGLKGEIEPYLTGFNLLFEKGVKSPYPDDIMLNAANLGDAVVCNTKFISSQIIDFANENNIKLIHTRQGYAKCNLCVLNNKTIITEDDNLACLLNNSQYSVLKITPGYIDLSDKHHGFIGGASAKISDGEIYFSGDISSHPDYKLIYEFITKAGIKPIFNKNRPLKDFGGIIPIIW